MTRIPVQYGPYWDDFDENKNFYQILFRPGYAVQARELTQLQSIYNTQIKRIGQHLFREGSLVIPGHVVYDLNTPWIIVTENDNHLATETERNSYWLNKVITNSAPAKDSYNVKAIVLHIEDVSVEAGTVKLYLKYTSGSENGEHVEFDAEDVITNTANDSAQIITGASATGLGSLAFIKSGVYFARDRFLKVLDQTIVIDGATNRPTKSVGLLIEESIVGPNDDSSLLDNAQGTPNYAAPGADRLKIDLILSAYDYSATADPIENFIELLRFEDGTLTQKVDDAVYSEIMKTLARRTHDESGDYTVRPFPVSFKEYYNDGSNGGMYTAANFAYTSEAKAKQISIDVFGSTVSGGESHISGDYYYPLGTSGALVTALENKICASVGAGKAYVKGYEIETLSNNYLAVDRATTSESSNAISLDLNLGNYVLVNSLYMYLMPDIREYTRVDLKDSPSTVVGTDSSGSTIGTAKVRGIQYLSGTPGLTAPAAPTPLDPTDWANRGIYALYLTDIQMNTGENFADVKCVSGDMPGGLSGKFIANVELTTFPMTGSVTASGASAVQIDGAGTKWFDDATEKLSEGQWIRTRNENALIRVSVTPDSNGSFETDTIIMPYGDLQIENSSFDFVYANLEEPENNCLIYTLPHTTLKEISTANRANISLVVRRQMDQKLCTAGNTTLTWSLTTVGETFEPFSNENYQAVVTESETPANLGKIYDLSDSAIVTATLNAGQTSLEIDFDDAVNGDAITLLATVRKTGNTAATAFNTKTISTDGSYTTVAGVKNLQEISLGIPDVMEILDIKMGPDDFSTYAVDDSLYPSIKSRYDLVSGQTDNTINYGKVVLKKGQIPPTGRVKVTFKYFSGHTVTGTGAYSVETYNALTLGTYEPIYSSNEIGYTYDLRDVLDFRPVQTGADTWNIVDFPKSVSLFAYTYYLNRKDTLYLTSEGKFGISAGLPALEPAPSPIPENAMALYYFDVQARTDGPGNVIASKIENKRYTMRDIGKLEKRLANLEYYTSLSLLEQDTKNIEITDERGLNRFKNGFFVDSLNNWNGSNTSDPDYSCSIDQLDALRPDSGNCRPRSAAINVGLELYEDESPEIEVTDDLLTLQWDPVCVISQNIATNAISVNPYNVFSFISAIDLNPDQDLWMDTLRLPDDVTEIPGDFEAVSRMVKQTGIVWNAWETKLLGTTYTDWDRVPGSYQREIAPPGSSISPGSIGWQRMSFVNKRGVRVPMRSKPGDTWPHRKTWLEKRSVKTTTQQVRTGIMSTVSAQYDRQVLGDKVVDVKYQEYLRAKKLYFKAKNLKPSTKLYAFFDGTDVTANCAQTSSSGTITSATKDTVVLNTGSLSAYAASTITIGDQVREIASYTSGTKTIKIAGNALNPIPAAGSQYYTSPISYGTGLLTTSAGTIEGKFLIPADHKFKCGRRDFVLSDSTISSGTDWTTRASATYYAEGMIQTKQREILSVKNALVSQTAVEQRLPVVTTISEEERKHVGEWIDPLAQSILFSAETYQNGVFITAVDLFFKAKDASMPVTVELREMINGYPGPTVYPFSRVTLDSADVNISDDASLATRFDMVAPVYVEPGAEVAIVVLSNSDSYYLWIATMGQDPGTGEPYKIVGTQTDVTKNPYSGVMFKSQNASTWTACQESDLTFQVYIAEFDAGEYKECEFVNKDLEPTLLATDPFETQSGSALMRVTHDNHALCSNSGLTPERNPFVVLDGADTTVGGNGNIPYWLINGRHYVATKDGASSWSNTQNSYVINLNTSRTIISGKITSADSTEVVIDTVTDFGSIANIADAYVGMRIDISGQTRTITAFNQTTRTVTVGVAWSPALSEGATYELIGTLDLYLANTGAGTLADITTGYSGGSNVTSLGNVQMDVLRPTVTFIKPVGTSIDFYTKTTSGNSVDGEQEPYTLETSYTSVQIDANNHFVLPRVVCSRYNEGSEILYIGSEQASEHTKSFWLKAKLYTNNKYVSPVIRVSTAGIGCIGNIVDSPTVENRTVYPLDYVEILSESPVTFATTASTLSTTDSGAMDLLVMLGEGDYISIDNTSLNNTTYRVSSVTDSGSSVTVEVTPAPVNESAAAANLYYLKNYRDEISPNSNSAAARYISQSQEFSNSCTALRILLAVYTSENNTVEVYFRTANVGNNVEYYQLPWTLATPYLTNEVSDSPVCLPPEACTYKDYEFQIDDLVDFNIVDVKVVMTGTNSADVPKIKDLRVIGIDT